MLASHLNRARRLGVEYEMAVPLVGAGDAGDLRQTFARVLSANGLRCISRPYSHAPLPDGFDLAVEHDASVQGESRYQGVVWHPVELKTRILNGADDWERIVPKALEICRYLGARVTPSCGHHVHVEMTEAIDCPETIRSVYNLLHRFEPVLFSLVSPSRRANSYCRRMDDRTKLLHQCTDLASYRDALAGWDRCRGLNLTHLLGAGPRIEFRYHQGTLEAEKARHWMRLVVRLVDHACQRSCKATPKQLAGDRRDLERFMVTVGLKVNSRVYSEVSPELRETGKFLLRRWKHFHGSGAGSAADQG
jgi:hypothetical protein